MKSLCRAILVAAGLGLSTVAGAQERPVVAVSFDLAVPRWQNQFGAAQTEFQSRAADVVAKWLSREVGFISFKPGVSGTPRLVVHLEVNPDAGSGPYKETQLRMELVGQAPTPLLVWLFRPETNFSEPTGGIEPFAREVQLRLNAMDKQALVRQVLSRVPIANNAQLWKDPVGWVIPYRKWELCMDFRSMLRIENLLTSGAGQIVRDFIARASGDFAPRDAAGGAMEALRGRLFTEAMPAQVGLADLGTANPEAVAIRAVYVVEYLPLQPCVGPVPLDAVDFREGTR